MLKKIKTTRAISLILASLILIFATSCDKGNAGNMNSNNNITIGSENSQDEIIVSHTSGSEGQTNSSNKISKLIIPQFSKFNYTLKNTDYAFNIRESGGNWQSITPYNVKVNSNQNQNISADDPVQNSPMIYFGMGDSPVEISIKANIDLKSVSVHPKTSKVKAKIKDGKINLTISKPENFALRVNGQRYEMIYIFAGQSASAPTKSGDGVRVIKNGCIKAPRVGTSGWKGGLSDLKVYNKALSAADISKLAKNQEVSGYTNNWKLDSDFKDNCNLATSTTPLGDPKIQKIGNRNALYLNGYEDVLTTSLLLKPNASDITLSAWVWLDESGKGATRGIFGEALYITSESTVGSNLEDWEWPYRSEKKIATNRWHNVVLVKKGNTLTAYIDGVNAGSKECTKWTDKYVSIGATGVDNVIYVKSNEKLIFEPGSVIEGKVSMYGSTNAEISGMGIISKANLTVAYSKNCKVSDVIVSNPPTFNLSLQQSDNIYIKNFKCFSSYGASDGINSKACKNITVDNCFIRSNDDSISVYATSVNALGCAENYTLKNSVLISDAGHAIMIGVHAQAGANETIKNFKAENVDIVDSKCYSADYQGVMAINAGDDVTVSDILFNNIRIEDIRMNQIFNLRVFKNSGYNKAPGKGIKNVTFSNITYSGQNYAQSIIKGYDSSRIISGVTFKNVVLNHEKLSSNSRYISVGEFAENINFK